MLPPSLASERPVRISARLEPVADEVRPEVGSFLDRLDEQHSAGLLALGTRRRFPAGSTVFMVGEPALEVLVVLSGEAKAVVPASDGREVIVGVRGPGDVLGEIAALDGGTRSATVVAIGELEVLMIGLQPFDAFLERHPSALRHLVLVIAGRLRASNRRQLEFGTGDSLGRLCARLVELSERYGEVDDDGTVRLVSPLTQTDLGALSGMSREAVVKSMRALRSLGWVRNDGRTIELLDPAAVRRRADH